MADTEPATGLIGVLDMGASAIRLVVAEIDRQAQRPRDRGGVARRPARPRHVFGRRHPLADRRRRARGARRVPPHHGRLRRRRHPGGGDERGPRGAQRATCSSTAFRAAPASRFEIINEAEESRLVYLAVRRCAAPARRRSRRRVDAADRGRRRQHQPHAAQTRAAHAVGRLRARVGAAAPAARPPPPHARNCRSRCSTATSRTSSRKSASRSRSTASRT